VAIDPTGRADDEAGVRRGRWRSVDWFHDLFAENSATIAALVLKLLGAFFSFVTIFIVARVSGAAVTGDYAMAVATAGVVSLLAALGLEQVTVRLMGGFLRENRLDLARAALTAVLRRVFPLSIAAALILFLLAPMIETLNVSGEALRSASLSVVAWSLLRVGVQALRATGSVIASQFLDSAHNLLIVIAILYVIYVGEFAISATMLGYFYSFSVIAVSALTWLVLWRRVGAWPEGKLEERARPTSNWPLLATALCHSLTQWIVLAYVGAYAGSADLGAFRVASQVVVIIALMVTTIEALVSPQFAGDFKVTDIALAWRRHRRTTILMGVAAGPPLIICVLAAGPLLNVVGPQFGVAAPALMIMAIAQIVNIATGPIGQMMVMSGNERLNWHLAVAGLVVAAVLSYLLVPRFPLVGAALATSLALVARNLIAFVTMKRLFPT
jgi:O-antigen/teichoic acid export membrane protein